MGAEQRLRFTAATALNHQNRLVAGGTARGGNETACVTEVFKVEQNGAGFTVARQEVEQVVDIFFEEIAQRLAEGGRIELRGFGAFSTREREARTGRNPRTGEAVDVPAKRVPYFKPGKEMRNALNPD